MLLQQQLHKPNTFVCSSLTLWRNPSGSKQQPPPQPEASVSSAVHFMSVREMWKCREVGGVLSWEGEHSGEMPRHKTEALLAVSDSTLQARRCQRHQMFRNVAPSLAELRAGAAARLSVQLPEAAELCVKTRTQCEKRHMLGLRCL